MISLFYSVAANGGDGEREIVCLGMVSIKKRLKSFFKKEGIHPQEYEEDFEGDAVGAFFFNDSIAELFVSVVLPKELTAPSKVMLSYKHELCSFYKINKFKELVLWMKSCKVGDMQLSRAKKLLIETDYQIIHDDQSLYMQSMQKN
jgi:hypothetical protein